MTLLAEYRAQERGRSSGNNLYRKVQRRSAQYEAYDDEYARDARPRTKSRVRALNEWGHDYEQAADDARQLDGVALAQVNGLLRDRLEAKLARDFGEADALLAQLEAEHGVTVNDGAKRWRADGASFARRYARARGVADSGVDEVDVAAVEELIAARVAARKERDYRRADGILAELLDDHGVALNDSAFTWRYVGGTHDGSYGEGGAYGQRRVADASDGHDYAREPGDDLPIEPPVLQAVHGLLAERLAAKKRRAFDEADSLQKELWELGVEVDDQQRTWYYVGKPQ